MGNERWSNFINIAEARRLLRKGLNLKEVGRRLAKLEQRRTPFQPESIRRALSNARRKSE